MGNSWGGGGFRFLVYRMWENQIFKLYKVYNHIYDNID